MTTFGHRFFFCAARQSTFGFTQVERAIAMRPHAKSNIRALLLIAVTGILPAAGCQICCDPDTLSYPTYGGIWERTRRDGGRVGSIFDPAGARASTLVQREDPRTPDERDRELRETDPNAFSLEPPTREEPPADSDDDDAKLQEKIKRLREQEMDGEESDDKETDIKIEPGAPAPPILF
jgi:hypothetical protein